MDVQTMPLGREDVAATLAPGDFFALVGGNDIYGVHESEPDIAGGFMKLRILAVEDPETDWFDTRLAPNTPIMRGTAYDVEVVG